MPQAQTASDDTEQPLFPIRVLSERTGVGSSTLRAWERRYKLLTPQRTPKGHRLYGDTDVRQVERVLELLHEGHSLSAIAGQLVDSRPPTPGPEHRSEASDKFEQRGVWHDYLQTTLRAVSDFSHERIEAVFNEASSLYPVDMVTERLIEPVLVTLGQRWQDSPTGIAEEHFYTSWVRNRLGARFHHGYGRARGARLVCACLPGAYHDIGLMLFSLSALTRGYRILYFGPDLPLSQIPPVVAHSGARGVVLASRLTPDDVQLDELADLTANSAVPVMLGGPVADRPLPSFEDAGGIRLGSHIAVALQVLAQRVPVDIGGSSPARTTGGPAWKP